MNSTLRLLRLPDVMTLTGICRSTIYKLIADGQFPQQIKLTTKTSAWSSAEVGEWIAARIAGRDASPVPAA